MQGWDEQFCAAGGILTYSGTDRQDGSLTQGGYSEHIVVREEFVCRLPDSLDIAKAAPLLCAGITTYSPLRKFGVRPARRSASPGSAGWGTWASSSPWQWART